MKIAFISDSVYPYNVGGKEKRLFDISTKLAEKGHEVHIYTMKLWKGKSVIKENNVYLHGICKKYPLYEGDRRSIKQALAFGLSCFKLINEDFDVIDADHMVYFHLFPIKLICLLKGKKMITTWNEVWGKEYWLSYMGEKGIFGHYMEMLASKLPDKIISISKHTTKRLIDILKVDKNKIFTSDNGVDVNSIKKVKKSNELFDVIYAGRFLGHKHIDKLILAIKKAKVVNPKIKCLILGNGPEKESLVSLVKENNLEKNIEFRDFIKPINKLYSLMKSSKVFVLPSTREGFGIVVIEANACGTPVVTINHPENASKDLIDNPHNGFLCSLDEKEISNKILQAMSKRDEMSPYCLKSSETFSWDNIIPKLENVYALK